MAKIIIITVGKRKEAYLRDAVEEFERRLSTRAIEYVIISPSNKDREGTDILKKADGKGTLIVLDEHGTSTSSMQMTGLLSRLDTSNLVFVIGGPDGLSPAVLEKASLRIALSIMTFTHEMAYLILLEQIYRAFSIKEGKKYHRV